MLDCEFLYIYIYIYIIYICVYIYIHIYYIYSKQLMVSVVFTITQRSLSAKSYKTQNIKSLRSPYAILYAYVFRTAYVAAAQVFVLFPT